MVVASGQPIPMGSVPRSPKAAPSTGTSDRPSLHRRERSSPVKNRKREICTSGSVRGEGGNILTYSASSAVIFAAVRSRARVRDARRDFRTNTRGRTREASRRTVEANKGPVILAPLFAETRATIRGPAMSVEGWGVGPLRHLVLMVVTRATAYTPDR